MNRVTWQSTNNSVCVLLLLLVLLPGGLALANDGLNNQTGSPEARAMKRVQEELETLERRWYGIARIRYTYPQQISAGFGAIFVTQPKDTECSSTCTIHGWQFEIEPGLYGTQASLGWGKLTGATGRTEHLMHTVYLGWAIRGVIMRTYGDFRYTPIPRTLAGVEGSFTFARLNFTLGILHSLSSGTGNDWVFSSGVGFGF